MATGPYFDREKSQYMIIKGSNNIGLCWKNILLALERVKKAALYYGMQSSPFKRDHVNFATEIAHLNTLCFYWDHSDFNFGREIFVRMTAAILLRIQRECTQNVM